MSIRVTHEIHKRRMGRNLGVALLLVAFIGIVFSTFFWHSPVMAFPFAIRFLCSS